MQRLANAKLENKRKQESLDQSTLSAEAVAYQKGLADSQPQYAAFHDTATKVLGNLEIKKQTSALLPHRQK